MWRICLLVLFLSSDAAASTFTAQFGAGAGSSGPFPSPRDAAFAIRDRATETLITEWRISGITPADEGRTWTITEATAPVGVDWSAFEAAAMNPIDYQFSSEFVGLNWQNYDVLQNLHGFGVLTGLDRIDFKLAQYFTSPIGSVADWTHEMTGPGRAIPEPSAILLSLLAIVLVHGWAGRLIDVF